MPNTGPQNLNQLRNQIKAQRANLSASSQKTAAEQCLTGLQSHPAYSAAQNIAFYLPVAGEVDPRLALETAHQDGKTCFLPCLQGPNQALIFRQYSPDNLLKNNQFGIPEPIDTLECTTEKLDLVCVPLVACTQTGHRLGMGGGYYDRTFAFKLESPNAEPTLIGLAYDFQVCESLPQNPWDIPMDDLICLGI